MDPRGIVGVFAVSGVTHERGVEPPERRELVLPDPGVIVRFGEEDREVVVVDEAADGFRARIDLGALAEHSDALLIALIGQISGRFKNAPEPGLGSIIALTPGT